MFCNKCGSQLPDDAKFCNACGAPIGAAAADNAQAGTAQTPPVQGQNSAGKPGSDFDFSKKPDDRTGDFDPADVAANKGLSVLSYLGILFFIPLVAKPDSKYCKFHSNQGLVLLILEIALGIVRAILNAVISTVFVRAFHVFWVASAVSGVLNLAVAAVTLGLMIYGIVNAATGKAKELPVIGQFHLLDK